MYIDPNEDRRTVATIDYRGYKIYKVDVVNKKTGFQYTEYFTPTLDDMPLDSVGECKMQIDVLVKAGK